jgi:hypothetical protein
MDTPALSPLLDAIAAASDTLTAQALTGPEQAELAAIIHTAVQRLRASGHLVHVPAGDDYTALHMWRHAVVGQLALFITAAELLVSDTDCPLAGAAYASADQVYTAAIQMQMLVEAYVAAHEG